MRKSQASVTALGIAMVRALESDRPRAERLLQDPHARTFARGPLMWLVDGLKRMGALGRWASGLTFLAIREREGDRVLKSMLEEGIEQLVILGGRLRRACVALCPPPRRGEGLRGRSSGDAGPQKGAPAAA